jgi:hydroxyethylthiazole kinase-like uncharacterized protein yjeF
MTQARFRDHQHATSMRPLYLRDTLSRWEHQVAALAPGTPLMDQAGALAARLALQLAQQNGKPIVVVAGCGNNGGDGLELAACLLQQGVACQVFAVDLACRYKGDAARALKRLEDAGGALALLPEDLGFAGLIVDAIYGTGLNRAPEGAAASAIARINHAARLCIPVLALDVPSGLVCDTGATPGAAVTASATITFLGAKAGLYTALGTELSGVIHQAPLTPAITLPADGWISGPQAFASLLKARPNDSNKGSFGTIGVMGGASGTVGAVLLAGRAALHLGAGKVLVQIMGDSSVVVDLLHPELMIRKSIELKQLDAIVIGPGLGDSQAALKLLYEVVGSPHRTVFDADALNLFSRHTDLKTLLRERHAPSIVTPHPLEAARLLGCDVKEVQADRIKAAQRIATETNSVVILKGAGSTIAAPDGRWAINPSGNPALASGGTGDVLSGALGGLFGQDEDAFETALAGCYLHGEAADDLVRSGQGPVGLTASELIPAIRSALNRHTAKA